MPTAPAPDGGRATNTAQATYHVLMHHLSHLVNAVCPQLLPLLVGKQLTLLKPHTS